MHTKFLLDDGRQVSVSDTFDSYSTLLNFDEPDTENTFEAKLIQTALPKMKVGFHETLSLGMQSEFEAAVREFNIYFIDLAEDFREAGFLIKNRNDEYYLVRNGGYRGTNDDRPMFFYQENVWEFIKQLEYIAQWQAVLELDNSRANIKAEDSEIVFETVEGITANSGNADTLPSRIHIDPDSLTLRYRNLQQPLFRCRVENNTNSPGAKFHVNFVYIDSRFGIQKLDCFDTGILENDHPVWVSVHRSDRDIKSIPLKIESFYLKNKIFEIQDYLLVILSTDPLDITALTQPFLEPINKKVSRKILLEESKQSFALPAGDWFKKKVPIRVIYDDRSFEQTVTETVVNRPVSTPDDLHKNRWGGKAARNGFELSAEVKSAFIPGLFDIKLQVRHKGKMLNKGSVAFLLHETFPDPIKYQEFDDGVSSVNVTSYEDFTAAAIVYDGTELELDLSELPGLPESFYAFQPKDKFKQQIESLLQKTPIAVPDDLHKKRWGGEHSKNGYALTATVKKNILPRLFSVTLEVISNRESSGTRVAFLLHDSFKNPVRIRNFERNNASISVTAYEDFTAAAIIDDGAQLELDLSKLPNLPEGFYAKAETENFIKKVESLEKKTPVTVPDDLQKNRWGGKAENNGKIITAHVVKYKDTHQVILTVESSDSTPLTGEVAFLLHDSFEVQTVFSKSINGKAIYKLNNYEAFTVGAYTEDGTSLELDLNAVSGYPKEFYYRN